MLITRAIEQFEAYATDVRRLSPRTVASYSSDLGLFAAWCKEAGVSHAVEDVTAETIENWMASRTHVFASTLQRNLASLSALFQFLVKRQIIERNPADLVDRPRGPDPQPTCLTEQQLQQLLAVIEDPQERALLLVLSLLGLRRSEVLQLDVSDVHLDAARVHVRNGKGGKSRLLPLPAELRPVLEEHLNARERRPEQPLFLSSRGSRLARSTLARWFSRWLEAADLADQGITPHSCRHFTATRWLKSGLSLPQVQLLLGHADVSVTSRYLHMTMDDVADELDAKVRPLNTADQKPPANGPIADEWQDVLVRLNDQQRQALMAVARSMLTS